MPAGIVLDWVTEPDHVLQFMVIRFVACIVALALLGAAYLPWAKDRAVLLGIGPPIVCASGIQAMILDLGGYTSDYYAGLNLCILAVGVLYTWRWWQALLVSGGIVAVWSLAGIPDALAGTLDIPVFINNFYFLSLTAVIAVASAVIRYNAARREFAARIGLAEASEDLAQAVDRLQELDRLKTNFFSNVTHELRTPLTMILAPLESLLEDAQSSFDSTGREYLLAIRGNALRLLKLINDLLDLARLEENYLRLRVERADLVALLHEIVEYARPLAARKDISIELAVQGNVAAHEVYVDTEKMERVIVNLLANALKFSESGGTVRIWIREHDGELQVGVHDDGPGIPEESQRWIFERFRQADGSVTRRFGGTGIGLALVKEIVELHGGRISIASEIGRGSEFVVHLLGGREHFPEHALDRRQGSTKAQAARRSDDREPREWTRVLLEQKDYRFLDLERATERRLAPRGDEPRATKVLVVEDNVEILRFLSLQLRDAHAVYLAPDGHRGLELAQRELPDVIITDYMMPGIDGLALIHLLKKDPVTAGIPIVMLTAKNDVADRLAAREAGADIYLSKPFSPQEVRAAVAQLLHRRGQQAAVVAREQVKSLEVISAGLAHEIHNPLSYIANAIYVLGQKIKEMRAAAAAQDATREEMQAAIDASREKTERMITVAKTGIERIRRVVELVRNYARSGYPKELTPQVFDEIVRDVGTLVIPSPDGSEVDVAVELGAPGVKVLGVPGELEQIVRNLWQNALEALAEGGMVSVRTSRRQRAVWLEIADDGPGMPPEVLSRIFTPFFTTKDPGRGMGLGLAITHQLVHRLGGQIHVESEVGRGTTFRVQLPISEFTSSD